MLVRAQIGLSSKYLDEQEAQITPSYYMVQHKIGSPVKKEIRNNYICSRRFCSFLFPVSCFPSDMGCRGGFHYDQHGPWPHGPAGEITYPSEPRHKRTFDAL